MSEEKKTVPIYTIPIYTIQQLHKMAAAGERVEVPFIIHAENFQEPFPALMDTAKNDKPH